MTDALTRPVEPDPTDLPAAQPAHVAEPRPVPGLRDRLARRAVHRLLAGLEGGRITLRDGTDTRFFGDPHASRSAEVRVRDPEAYRRWLRGSAELGASYADGAWDADDLVEVIRVLIAGAAPLERALDTAHRLTRPVLEPLRRARRPDAGRDARNVRAHYDLSNDFFERFLDPTMTYSSAVFDRGADGLEDAQREKLDRLCRKLDIGADDHVLEIGTGWGSFAVHAASTRGCRVTTATLSPNQARLARQRVAAAGLADLVDVRLADYRELHGRFDALVSIEMIEAVDWRDHATYFETCGRLLRPGGLMGLQAIVIADERYERARSTTDFIKAHVFPGGCLPSVSRIAEVASEAGRLRVVDLEDLGAHYAETLARWQASLDGIAPGELSAMGLDGRFRRLWAFYLAYCRGAFLERHVSVVQAVLAPSGWRPAGVAPLPR